MIRESAALVAESRRLLGYIPRVRVNRRLGVISVDWLRPEPHSGTIKESHEMSDPVFTNEQIKKLFRDCGDRRRLDAKLESLIHQCNDTKLIGKLQSMAGQIRAELPEAPVKPEPTTTGPKVNAKSIVRPAELDPLIHMQWITLPIETARGDVSHWRTQLVRHDASGLDKSGYGEYKKGADGVEYFYATVKIATVKGVRGVKRTPAEEIAAYRAAADKSGIELSNDAYSLLSRNRDGVNERTIYAQAHIARIKAKKAAKAAVVTESKVADAATPAPVAPVKPVVVVAPVARGTLSFK